ncbi:MAG: hypothetical protein HLUCCA11_08330 [Phormidesmis priestleyi Ana]|uniref:Uncharacterized protein n=1 Tax=Phormidesmis priestleyi Ana TaxID=1666911 RepID=A0A0P7YZG6_9CYAN|nr:MAG: hypothetical protein HLUCCA11_08330 [Phormidesmis priestleyi Ana]
MAKAHCKYSQFPLQTLAKIVKPEEALCCKRLAQMAALSSSECYQRMLPVNATNAWHATSECNDESRLVEDVK